MISGKVVTLVFVLVDMAGDVVGFVVDGGVVVVVVVAVGRGTQRTSISPPLVWLGKSSVTSIPEVFASVHSKYSALFPRSGRDNVQNRSPENTKTILSVHFSHTTYSMSFSMS